MSKTILLIENDAPFAEEMSGALEAMGFRVRMTGDGKEGLDLARDLRPDAIVLCVELPRLSGYSICNKLKKDEVLRSIPLLLTSSEATEEVFEDHRKLKVRAEDYLIKPYVSAVLLDKLAALIGLPQAGASPAQRSEPAAHAPGTDGGDEEVVSLEEDVGLEPFGGEPGQELPALDLDSLPDEPSAAGAGGLDEDLKLLDDAFDGLSAPPASPASRPPPPLAVAAGAEAQAAGQAIEKAMGVDRPVTSEDLEAASASLPDEDEGALGADLGGLAAEADIALGDLGEVPPGASAFDALDALEAFDEPAAASAAAAPSPGPALAAGAAVATAVASAALFAATGSAASGAGVAELARLEAELAERRAALGAREADLAELRSKLAAAMHRADEAESALSEREAETASHRARGDTLAAQARKAETEARAARDEGRRATEQLRAAEVRAEAAEARVAAAEGRIRSAEQEAAVQRRTAEQASASLAAKAAELVAALAAAARLVEMEGQVERLESDLVEARGELEGTRSEVEKRMGDLKRRISELEAANSKNEERVVKAYLKIKGDEKVRDKARKALAIALQLLEEGLPAEQSGEKRPRPVPE